MISHKLDTLRKKIDVIDRKILKLIAKRYGISVKILAEKTNHSFRNSVQVFDPKREQHIIGSLIKRNNGYLPDESIERIFQSIIETCRNIQTDIAKKEKLTLINQK